MRRQSFTLLELLITIGVIMILAGIVVGGMTMAGSKSADAKTQQVMKEFELALEKYKADKGTYPIQSTKTKSDENFEVDFSKDAWKKFKAGDFLAGGYTGRLKDGNDYVLYYRYPGVMNKGGYDLWSVGEDGWHGKKGSGHPSGAKEPGSVDQAGKEDSDDVCNWRQ